MSVPSSFSVSGSSGILGSWLSQSTSIGGVASLLGGSSSSAGGLTALLAHAASSTPSTTQALEAGALTNSQQRVIQAIGDTTGPLAIPWNANGTEPTTVAAIRQAGWIKLASKTVSGGKATGGTYTLTAVGEAIYQRTGGGSVNSSSSSTALTSAETNGTSGSSTASSADAALQSSVSSLTSLLGAVGVSV